MIRNDSGNLFTVLCMANRTEFVAKGFAGAKDGSRREHRINGQVVDPKGRLPLAPGDRITMIEAGGGGYGDPKARDRERVRSDVANGFVSAESARHDYGLDVD